MRLNKFLATAGVASRRKADEMIVSGLVSVNGKKVDSLGLLVDIDRDIVTVSGKKISLPTDLVYYLLHKPLDYVTTSDDPRGRKIVTSLVPKNPRVFAVGRLDKDTTGLLLMTNDGDLTYRLTHPKFEKEKEYIVTVRVPGLDYDYKRLADKFLSGVRLAEGLAKADKMKFVSHDRDLLTFSITLHQGWNRQIRRMCEKIGCRVTALCRVRMGDLVLGNLKIGEYRQLSSQELQRLR